MPATSLIDRGRAMLDWIEEDARLCAELIRRPWSYGRWYGVGQGPRLRGERRVWVIASDVAQVYIGLRFIKEVRRRHPHLTFVFSVCTRAAHRIAAGEVSPGDEVTYVPMPFSPGLWRALSSMRPLALVTVLSIEQSRLLWLARRRGIPVAWIAAEMADDTAGALRSAREQFERARFIQAIDVLCANTPGDGQRLAAFGFSADRIEVVGPAKYDAALPFTQQSAAGRALLDAAGIDATRLVLLGGSIVDGEDIALMDVYTALKPHMPQLVLALALRDVRRGGAIAFQMKQRGLTVLLRSEMRRDALPGACPDVFIVDSVGELKGLYASATVVFVGRSLSARTGSNLMEPAGYGKPLVIGPYFERFEEPLADFRAARAVCQVADVDELRRTIAALLQDPDLRAGYGQRAYEVVTRNAGALRRTVECLDRSDLFRQMAPARRRTTSAAQA